MVEFKEGEHIDGCEFVTALLVTANFLTVRSLSILGAGWFEYMFENGWDPIDGGVSVRQLDEKYPTWQTTFKRITKG